MPDAPRISVIVPTSNRPTLARALRTCTWADEVVVVFDAPEPPSHPAGCVVLAVGPTRNWGSTQRNLAMREATGTHFAFMDDDDVYLPGAGDAIRRAVVAEPDRVHVFCMRNRDRVISGPLVSGAVSSQMLVVPRAPVGDWSGRYGDDLDFITHTMRLRGDEPVFHPEVIASIRPPTRRRMLQGLVDPRIQRNVARRTVGRVRRRLGR